MGGRFCGVFEVVLEKQIHRSGSKAKELSRDLSCMSFG